LDLGFKVGGLVWAVLALLSAGYYVTIGRFPETGFVVTQGAAVVIGGLVTWQLIRWAHSVRARAAEAQRATRQAESAKQLKAFLDAKRT
jgi:CO/xanthine dehydrogenase FAD-binding subunit